MQLKQVLEQALKDCDSTTSNPSLIRPSKSGTPASAYFLENYLFPKLEKSMQVTKEDADPVLEAEKQMTRIISTGIGFLFEKAVVPVLRVEHSNYQVLEQVPLTLNDHNGDLLCQGTADFVVIDNAKKEAVVMDAKAFNIGTLREIQQRRLTDDWSYITQLSIYRLALQQKLGAEWNVKAKWIIYSIPARKLFRVDLKSTVASSHMNAFFRRHALMQELVEALAEVPNKGVDNLVDLLLELPYEEQLPPKAFFYGRLAASTGFHYHPLASIFYDLDPESEDYGLPLDTDQLRSIYTTLITKAIEEQTLS